jgi:hypothetical protein
VVSPISVTAPESKLVPGSHGQLLADSDVLHPDDAEPERADGLLGSATTGLNVADASRPAATLASDRNLAVATGFALASFITLAYGIIYGFTAGIMLASMSFIGAILSSSYGRYLFSVYIGKSYKLPLRFSAFLEWCHSAGILRLSGAGYQFRHRELLDYLVEQPAGES